MYLLPIYDSTFIAVLHPQYYSSVVTCPQLLPKVIFYVGVSAVSAEREQVRRQINVSWEALLKELVGTCNLIGRQH